MSRMVPPTYRSTHALAPQSKMLAARMPWTKDSSRSRALIASSSASRSGSTRSATEFSRSFSRLFGWCEEGVGV